MRKFLALTLSLIMCFCMIGCSDIEYSDESYGNDDYVDSFENTNDQITDEQSDYNQTYEDTYNLTEHDTESESEFEYEETEDSADITISETMVWIPTNGGTKYHSRSSCSNMKNPKQVAESEAIALGFEACKRCH